MPTASVRVRPGMLPATTMVAPNSPRARENPSIAPARMLRAASGSVIGREHTPWAGAERLGDLLVAPRDLLEAGAGGANEQRQSHDRHRDDDGGRGEHDLDADAREQLRRRGPRRLNSQSSRSPVATGGITSGSETTVSTSDLPGNWRARQQPGDRDTRARASRAVAASAASVVKIAMSRISAFTRV